MQEIEVASTQVNALGIFAGSHGQQKMLAVANEFKAICEQKSKKGKAWVVPIGPGRHVTIEGWQYLGQRVGICGRTAETSEIRNPTTGEFEGYRAVAEIQRLDTGEIVGRAEQCCFADESLKKKDGSTYKRWLDDAGQISRHAIMGMAQTRAQSRALASVIRFLAELAGLDGTPAEEMEGVQVHESRPPISQPQRKSEVKHQREPGDLEFDGEIPPGEEGVPSITGIPERFAEKPTKKGGKRYGICINTVWINTFDSKLNDFAKDAAARKQPVIVYYTEGQYGKDATDIKNA